MEMTIDIEKLRNDLINYFGSAMVYYPQTVIELSNVQSASASELVNIAIKNGFNLKDYEIGYSRYL